MGPELFNIAYQFMVNFAFLIFAAMGLIVVLGMLNIINLAHGEFIMLGAYTATLSVHAGLPFILAIPVAMVAVGLFGMILERLVIRRFYANKLNALVATFGLSLILSQGVLLVAGPYLNAVAMPFGGFQYGAYSYSIYFLVLALGSVVLLLSGWVFFYRTRIGVEMRATIQNKDMARALGVRGERIDTLTFGLGAALAGLTGALYAPTTSVVPLFGQSFIAPAFITVVIGGGVNPLLGALSSAGFLSAISTPLSSEFGTFAGRIGLMIAALIVIRFLPQGFSHYLQGSNFGWFKRRQEKASSK